jgi:chemotaxis signal transduction protein
VTAEEHRRRLVERLLPSRARRGTDARDGAADAGDEAADARGEEAPTSAVLPVRLGTELFAVPVRHVDEVVMEPAVTPIPRARDEIRGVFLHRGLLIPLVDAGRLLGLPPAGGAVPRAVIVSEGDDALGLLVDEVLGIVDPPAEAWEPLPAERFRHVTHTARLADTLPAPLAGSLAARLDVASILALAGYVPGGAP